MIANVFMITFFTITMIHLSPLFISFFESILLLLENTTPTANHTEKQMHVVDACFWPLPLTTTQNDGVEPTQENAVWLVKLSVRELTKIKKLNWRTVTPLCLFGNSSPTWRLTNDSPALGAKRISTHPLPSSQQVPVPSRTLRASVCGIMLASASPQVANRQAPLLLLGKLHFDSQQLQLLFSRCPIWEETVEIQSHNKCNYLLYH